MVNGSDLGNFLWSIVGDWWTQQDFTLLQAKSSYNYSVNETTIKWAFILYPCFQHWKLVPRHPIFYHSRNTNHISNPNPSDHVTRPRPSPTHLNTINLLALHPPSQTNDVTTIKITHILWQIFMYWNNRLDQSYYIS